MDIEKGDQIEVFCRDNIVFAGTFCETHSAGYNNSVTYLTLENAKRVDRRWLGGSKTIHLFLQNIIAIMPEK